MDQVAFSMEGITGDIGPIGEEFARRVAMRAIVLGAVLATQTMAYNENEVRYEAPGDSKSERILFSDATAIVRKVVNERRDDIKAARATDDEKKERNELLDAVRDVILGDLSDLTGTDEGWDDEPTHRPIEQFAREIREEIEAEAALVR